MLGSGTTDTGTSPSLKFPSVTLPAQNLSLGGGIITLSSTATINTAQAASAVMSLVDASLAKVTAALADIGDRSKLISAHSAMVQNLSNVLSEGMGDLTNAANNLLQLKITDATEDFVRFAFNSTFGLGGLLDWATPAGRPLLTLTSL